MQKLKAHPDLGGDQWNAAVINEAYAVLSKPEKRAKYDAAQTDLRKSAGVGAGIRAGANESAPQSEDDERDAEESANSDEEELGAPPPPTFQTSDPLVCVFCRTRNQGGKYLAANEVCQGCGGPTRLVVAATSRERGARRIEHQGAIQFRVDSSTPRTYPANVVDLSPTGLRFVSKHRLRQGCIVKLDSPTLSAVARVTHSSRIPAQGQFSTGVKFVTLKLITTRGTFVSARA